MNLTRTLAIVVLGVVVFASLLTANVVLATDRTVLDEEYAAGAADEANLEAAIADELETTLRDEVDIEDEEALPVELSTETLVEESVTESHVAEEFETNLARLYAYLSGDASELRLAVDATPVKENAVAVVADEVATIGPADVDDERGAAIEEMAESEAAFLDHRAAFEADAKERIQEETARELSDEELERAYEDNRKDIREAAHEEATERVDEAVRAGDVPAAFEGPVRELAAARIDALTGAIGYDEYVERVDAAMADLRATAVAEFEAELDEHVPDAIDLTEELGEESTAHAETARSVADAWNTLGLALPALALLAGGLIAWLGSASGAAIAIGTVSSTAGIAGLVAARIGDGILVRAVADADAPAAAATFVEVLVGGALSALAWQSGLTLAGGVVVAGIGVAIRYDVILPDRE